MGERPVSRPESLDKTDEDKVPPLKDKILFSLDPKVLQRPNNNRYDLVNDSLVDNVAVH